MSLISQKDLIVIRVNQLVHLWPHWSRYWLIRPAMLIIIYFTKPNTKNRMPIRRSP